MTLEHPQVIVTKENETMHDVMTNILKTQNEEQPFYIFEVDDVILKYKTWLEKMPRVHPFFAVKCNHGMEILKILAKIGAGFDCASISEIRKILSLGVHPDRIIFANPTKPKTYLQYAHDKKVEKITFDNEIELVKTKKLYPEAKLVIRIRCDAKVAASYLGEKFGCDPLFEAPRLLQKAKDLGLNVIGVCFHVGSDTIDHLAYRRGISECRRLFEYAKTIGYYFNFVDIGGGFGGKINAAFNEACEVINRALDEFFHDFKDLQIIAEPGRFICDTAYNLFCNIHSKREIRNMDDNSLVRNEYYLNDGVFGSFVTVLVENRIISPFLLHDHSGEEQYPSILWGPTLDSMDKIGAENLPDLHVGEWIGFHEMGAYSTAAFSEFNGILLATMFIMIKEKTLEEFPMFKSSI